MSIIKISKHGKQYLVELPETELLVLTVLLQISRSSPVSAREIEIKFTKDYEEPLSYASIFTLLKRLKRRNLVIRTETNENLRGSKYKVVLWEKNFKSMREVKVLKSAP